MCRPTRSQLGVPVEGDCRLHNDAQLMVPVKGLVTLTTSVVRSNRRTVVNKNVILEIVDATRLKPGKGLRQGILNEGGLR